jgi:hypothetical protein
MESLGVYHFTGAFRFLALPSTARPLQDHKPYPDDYAQEYAAHDRDESPYAALIACEQFVLFRIMWRLRFHSAG